MSEKCYANFVCSDCATMIYDMFEYTDIHEAINHSITCPICGRKNVETTAPDSMKDIILLLLQKGYHVFNIYEKTLCIVIKGRFENIGKLPDEFTLDRTEDIGDIIVNDRMRANDFEGIDKEEYTKTAISNLHKWIQNLEIVNDGNKNAYVSIDETTTPMDVELPPTNAAAGYTAMTTPFPIKNGIACKYTWEEVNDMYDALPEEEKEKYHTLESYIDTLFDPEDIGE